MLFVLKICKSKRLTFRHYLIFVKRLSISHDRTRASLVDLNLLIVVVELDTRIQNDSDN